MGYEFVHFHNNIKVNSTKDYDPDWGKKRPRDGWVFRVIVRPNGFKKKHKWYFILMVPNLDNEKEMSESEALKAIVKFAAYICSTVLEEKDEFEIYEFSEEDFASYEKNVPFLCYKPRNPTEFHWLRPPQSLMC